MALLTGVCFLALVAVGVGYVVSTDPHHTGRAAPTAHHAASTARGSSSPVAPSATSAGQPLPSGRPRHRPRHRHGRPPGISATGPALPRPTLKLPVKRLPPTAPAQPTPLPPPALDFTLSSFNVLGASHTTGSGEQPGRASGQVRGVRAAALVRRDGSDVVGFQELQSSQLAALERHTNLDFYPGFSLRRQDSENSIGWRRDRWVAVERHTVRIPYFDGGARAMPFVRLRSLSTGLEVWFANFHNPADTAQYRHQQRFRSRATDIEIALTNQLVTTTGLPVFVTGDMNERASYFCRFTARTPMVAARGGSNSGRCLAAHPRTIDWIFGSRGVRFTGYYEDRSRLAHATTDHPVVVARVHIGGRPVGG